MGTEIIIKLLIDAVLIFIGIIIVINHAKPSCKNCVNLRNENAEKSYGGYANEGFRYIGWKNCPYKEFNYAPKHCTLYEPRKVKEDKNE